MNAQPVTIAGHYYDGRQPLSRPATLIFIGEDVTLHGVEPSQTFAGRALLVSPRVGCAERFIDLPNGGQFLAPDSEVLDHLRQYSEAEGVAAWLEARMPLAVAGVVIIVALLLFGYFVGLPAAAGHLAQRIPMETERTLGREVLEWLDGQQWFQPSQIDEETQLVVRQGFNEMTLDLPTAAQLRLEFRNSKFIGANAFALPGGTIVITDGMIKQSESDDELLAVLAHEIGHVELRHAMRHVLQSSAVAVLVATVTADAASLSAAVAGLPAVLAQARYSREFETEADDFAFELLKRHDISPAAFASIMERLAADRGEQERAWSFIASHPVTAERVERARAAAEP